VKLSLSNSWTRTIRTAGVVSGIGSIVVGATLLQISGIFPIILGILLIVAGVGYAIVSRFLYHIEFDNDSVYLTRGKAHYVIHLEQVTNIHLYPFRIHFNKLFAYLGKIEFNEEAAIPSALFLTRESFTLLTVDMIEAVNILRAKIRFKKYGV